jgi:hypothetical protein
MYGINPPQFDAPWEQKRWFSSISDYIESRTAVVNKTAAYTVAEGVFWVRVDATGGAVTVTLPLALGRGGRQIGVIKTDSSGNAVTVSRSGSDVINGATTQSLASQYSRMVVISDDTTNWDIIVKQ